VIHPNPNLIVPHIILSEARNCKSIFVGTNVNPPALTHYMSELVAISIADLQDRLAELGDSL
jgi:hypothetical protein